ncbi:hypothetical protein ACOWPH_06310 [Anabaena sp. PCC 7938]|nr:hypothetical protein [Anabaena sp. CCAP 1446/1C]MBY5281590.1 hypothetical protein [Anabaena sp. CCAP 1446/1C]MCM2409227.1 hypothetical protein [Anabaena sp. CCAP 1446/1C]
MSSCLRNQAVTCTKRASVRVLKPNTVMRSQHFNVNIKVDDVVALCVW